jgi:hypothetical protein
MSIIDEPDRPSQSKKAESSIVFAFLPCIAGDSIEKLPQSCSVMSYAQSKSEDSETPRVMPLEVAWNPRHTTRETWQRRLASDLSLPIHDAFLMLIVKVGRYLRGRSKFWSFALGVGMIAVIGEVDLLTGPEIGFSIFYLFPIGFMTWSAGRAQGIVLSLLSAGVWLATNLRA